MLALARVVADNEMRHRPQTMPQAALGAALRQGGGFTGANHPDWKPGQPDQAAGFLYAATRRRSTTALSANSQGRSVQNPLARDVVHPDSIDGDTWTCAMRG